MIFKPFITLLVLTCGGLVACQNTSTPDAATQAFVDTDSSTQTVTAMSFNLRLSTATDGENAWMQRKEDVITLIHKYQVDILGVQEALPVQMQDLQQGLPHYASIGVGRDPDNQGEFSAIFYSRGKLQLLAEDTFWLSPTPETPSKGWDAALNRICTWGRFQVRATGREFLVFNTHFDHVGEEARRQSAQLILKKISELNPDWLPVILSGDFNLTDDEIPIGIISTHMQDSCQSVRFRTSRPKSENWIASIIFSPKVLIFSPMPTWMTGVKATRPVTHPIIFLSWSDFSCKKDRINCHPLLRSTS